MTAYRRGTRGRGTRVGGIGALLAALALVVSACTGSSSDKEAEASGGPSGTLTVALGTTGAQTWAPSQSGGETLSVLKHVSDSLLTRNQNGETVGMLATEWSVSDDGMDWSFTLQPDVQFHDDWGTLTSEDVKYTWGEWMRKDSNQNSGPQLYDAIGGDLDNIEVVDDLHFVIHLVEPSYDLEALVIYPSNALFITSKKYHEEDPNADKHPIGTGPWEFVSSKPGVEVVMKANHDYWGTVPSFENLIIKEVPDSAARLSQVESGQLDISSIDSNLVQEAKNAGVNLLSFPDIGDLQVILGGMYNGDPALDREAPWIQADDPEKGLAIRQAMSLAIDRDLILETILNGYGEVAYGVLVQFNSNPDTTDPSWELPGYNLEEAKQKLAEGGYPDGFPVEVFLYPDDVDTQGVGQAIAGMWEDLGLQVTRRPSDEDTLDPLLNEKKTQGFVWVKLTGWDPITVALDQYTSHRTDGDYKVFHPAIDEGLECYESTGDPAEKSACVIEMETKLRDDMALIPLFNVDIPVMVGPAVGDWTPIPGDKELNALNTVTHAG